VIGSKTVKIQVFFQFFSITALKEMQSRASSEKNKDQSKLLFIPPI